MTDNVRVPAGKLFCFSSGDYSDYGYEGHFLALVDITRELLAEAVSKARATPDYSGDLPTEEWEIDSMARRFFIPELVRMGAVLDIDCSEIHIGSYGRLEVE